MINLLLHIVIAGKHRGSIDTRCIYIDTTHLFALDNDRPRIDMLEDMTDRHLDVTLAILAALVFHFAPATL